MAKVILSISMSLDGFVAGPNVSPQQPLGENGMRLHDWIFDGKTDADTKIMEELMIGSGAVLAGKKLMTSGSMGVGAAPLLLQCLSSLFPKVYRPNLYMVSILSMALKKPWTLPKR